MQFGVSDRGEDAEGADMVFGLTLLGYFPSQGLKEHLRGRPKNGALW